MRRSEEGEEKVCGNEASENRRDRGRGCQSKSTKSIPCIAVHIMHNNPDDDPSSHWFRREKVSNPSRHHDHDHRTICELGMLFTGFPELCACAGRQSRLD
jgi:hypothetical protein